MWKIVTVYAQFGLFIGNIALHTEIRANLQRARGDKER